ncbi:hypothetical protein [Segetibacter aerophilus]|uniref:Uncharacterized protein n=1 Tax=Segetibacter aerophilus TaxID=670293 RepID=A0A512BGJ7_9BACT|nr:hypothetical protein [Segetibacter aerophilus]GEO11084.1 hypothetical protein SAE01_35800 [Segetibacter aerophilus]
MKKLITPAIALIATGLLGCGASREIQADFVSAQVIKVDTVYRYPRPEKVLTWQCQNKVTFFSFVPMSSTYAVGTYHSVQLTK